MTGFATGSPTKRPMKEEQLISISALLAILTALAALLTAAGAIHAESLPSSQPTTAEQFFAHNSKMTRLQPALITPVMTADPRLIQYARFSVSHQYTAAGTETVSYGNGRGGGVIVGNRLEFDWMPPAYIQHNSTALDGAADTSVLGKVRIASGNAEHGNFDVAAMLANCFATGSHKNGAATDSFTPTVAAAKAFGKFDAISALGGTLPTGKIATQGRTVNWNSLVQMHANRHVWLEVEDNATFYFAGSHDGKMQNFILPAAFYVARGSEWKSTHPFFIFDAGMQIATSRFHTYNHNLIAETRIIF